MKDINVKNKRVLIIVSLFLIILSIVGGTYAYYSWYTNNSLKTNIVASVSDMCVVSVDGGGSIDSSSVSMVPTTCTNTNNAIIKEINSEISFSDSEIPVQIVLSLKVNDISDELTETTHFKYAITDSPTDCVSNAIASGSFNGVEVNDTIELVSDIYTISDIDSNRTANSKYYLYIWLDKEETNPNTAGTSFDFSLTALCNVDNEYGMPNSPVLDSGMIPVKISNDGTVTTISEDDNTWYNYNSKEWANAILVTESSRSSYLNTTGIEVQESDILGYYVWIPRFKYKIWSTSKSSAGNEQVIDIIFEKSSTEKSVGISVGEYLTHPAFTFGTKELDGFWVGKFETTGTADTPTVLPNTASLRSQNVSTQFQTSLKFAGGTLSDGNVTFAGSNTYGLTSNTDSHMMKNSEWGAVAYLSHSKYGINAEVRSNNNYNFITGCGASSVNGNGTSECQIQYGNAIEYPQSTTGNISGIYDMAGGALEYVMGNYNNTAGSSGFTIFPSSKYYDLYTSSQFNGDINTNISLCTLNTCGGHSLYETAGWYNTKSSFINSGYPWFLRSGNSVLYEGESSLFFFDSGYGSVSGDSSFRLVLNQASSYNVKYDANGGSNAPNTQIINEDNLSVTISNVVPTREGYRFLNWNTKQDGSGTTYVAGDTYSTSANITLYAQWTVASYILSITKGTGISTVYYKVNGASDYSSSSSSVSASVNYGTSYSYYGVASTGYTLSTCTELSPCSGTVGTSNISENLSATVNTYTISYNANGGSGEPSSQIKIYGSTLILSSTVPTRSGYTFLGWSTSSSATSATYAASGSFTTNANTTLYAVWRLSDSSGANAPVLDTGMIPVTIANDGTVTTVSSSDSTWYDYSNKKWANAILVTESSRSSYLNTTGTTVTQSDILAYYVWIPRFKYKIWTTSASSTGNEQTIDIIFESSTTSKSNGTTIGEYLTHPAFTFGGNELDGFWVGKFETTGNATTPTILPNETSLRSQNVSTQFQTSLKFAEGTLSNGNVTFVGSSTYGLTSNTDSHMMKSNEWGAVAYLSHSIYGINTEVRINNNYSFTTGCGASSANGSGTSECQIQYGNASEYPQSTTGNITGIYDMSGGAYEYVMGVYSDGNGNPRSGNNTSSNSGFNGIIYDSGNDTSYTSGVNFPSSKYYNIYLSSQFIGDYSTNKNYCTLATCGGHALYETIGWYSDYSYFFITSNPWFKRGGACFDGSSTGLFSINFGDGNSYSDYSWRSVLINIRSYSINYDANGGSNAPST